MLRVFSILGLLLLAGCKSETANLKAVPAAPLKEYSSNTSFPVDSSLFAGKPKHVKDFYHNKGFQTVWTHPGDRDALLQAVGDATYDGLQPEDYFHKALKTQEAAKKYSPDECIRHDLMLTEAYSKLATHLFKGKVQAKSLYQDWDLKPKKLNVSLLLAEAIKEHKVAETLQRCRPPHAIYASLRNGLRYLDSLPDDSCIAQIKYIKPIVLNDSTPGVRIIKKRLAYWKDLNLKDTSGAVFDRKMLAAVKKFQLRHGIYANGIIDSQTAAELNVTKEQRRKQLLVNLERWRWFAYDFGENALVINIPNYWLAVVENNKDTVEMHKVIVGKPERKTPVLYSRLNYLIINPTWTVPPTILKEDLTPSAAKDTAYFASLNMKIYDYYHNEISPAEWNPEEAENYYYVQGPGERNSLGQVKFNFRNSHTVYLHDTNHKEYFHKSKRALSSGCVRVQNPFKLARYVLELEENSDYSPGKLDEILTEGMTQRLDLKKVTHVHQLYWTAWMDKDGLQFRNDIYNLDKALYDKLRKQP